MLLGPRSLGLPAGDDYDDGSFPEVPRISPRLPASSGRPWPFPGFRGPPGIRGREQNLPTSTRRSRAAPPRTFRRFENIEPEASKGSRISGLFGVFGVRRFRRLRGFQRFRRPKPPGPSKRGLGTRGRPPRTPRPESSGRARCSKRRRFVATQVLAGSRPRAACPLRRSPGRTSSRRRPLPQYMETKK